METLLTGGTGYIGSAVLDALVEAGHHVRAVVRDERGAAAVVARGATALRLDLFDADATAAAVADVDALVHAAAPAQRADELNAAVVGAAVRAFGDGRGRVVLTSGIWIRGEGDDLVEEGPLDAAPELVAWRVPLEERLLASSVDARIIEPGVVYGHGRGLVGLITDAPRTEEGALRLIGDGTQRWTWVHVDDLARLYVAVLERDEPVRRVIASDGAPTAVRDIAAVVAGPAGVAPESADATRARLGTAFADALLLDQAARGTVARTLGWTPTHDGVISDLLAAEQAA